jgi:hypothetical protein
MTRKEQMQRLIAMLERANRAGGKRKALANRILARYEAEMPGISDIVTYRSHGLGRHPYGQRRDDESGMFAEEWYLGRRGPRASKRSKARRSR